jgi:hypothetical protein
VAAQFQEGENMTVFKQGMIVVLTAMLVACGDSKPPSQQRYGQVGIALVTTAPDGSMYRLPAGAQVELNSGQFDLVQILDGNAPEIDVAVPPGPYTATLFDLNFDTPVTWTLDHLDSGGNLIGTVSATLLTPMPVALNVTSSQTTSLVFSFRIPTGGTISFDRGTIAITLSVIEQEAQSYSFDISSSLTVTSSTVPEDSPIAAVVSPVGTAGLSIEIGGPVVGPWIEIGGETGDDVNSFSVCAPPGITVKIANGTTAFNDFISEIGIGTDPLSLFGTASLCIIDDGTNNTFRVRLSRDGAPATPSYLPLGPGPFYIRMIMQTGLPHRAYDYAAHTLNLAQLMSDSGAGLPVFSTSMSISDVVDGNIENQEYRAVLQAPAGATFSFTGQ